MTYGLTPSGTGCFIAVRLNTYDNSGRQGFKVIFYVYCYCPGIRVLVTQESAGHEPEQASS